MWSSGIRPVVIFFSVNVVVRHHNTLGLTDQRPDFSCTSTLHILFAASAVADCERKQRSSGASLADC